jgi:anti-anti-sigma factor
MGPSVSFQGEAPKQPRPPSLQETSNHAFCLAVKELGSTLHLRLSGEFDLACIGRVEAALDRVSDEKISQVVFDLSELSFLDSAALHTILRANERASRAAFDVVVVRPRGLANRVFTLTRAGEQLKLVDGAFPSNGRSC